MSKCSCCPKFTCFSAGFRTRNTTCSRSLDDRFNIVNSSLADREERISALTFINPRYIFEFKNSVIADVRIMSGGAPNPTQPCHIRTFIHPARPQPTKPPWSGDGDMLILLLVVIRTPFGLEKLLHEWPQVMTAIINKENVREPEIFNLRKRGARVSLQQACSYPWCLVRRCKGSLQGSHPRCRIRGKMSKPFTLTRLLQIILFF